MLRFDGQPVSRSELERVANALRAHGPDRSDIIRQRQHRLRPCADAHDARGSIRSSALPRPKRVDDHGRPAARQSRRHARAHRIVVAGGDVLAGFAHCLERVGKIRRRRMADAARSVRGRDLGSAKSHSDTGARSDRAQCRDVASKRALLRIRHHAQRSVCDGRRASRIERGEIRRFPGAQSRRPRDHDLQGYLSGSSGACHAGRCRAAR